MITHNYDIINTERYLVDINFSIFYFVPRKEDDTTELGELLDCGKTIK